MPERDIIHVYQHFVGSLFVPHLAAGVTGIGEATASPRRCRQCDGLFAEFDSNVAVVAGGDVVGGEFQDSGDSGAEQEDQRSSCPTLIGMAWLLRAPRIGALVTHLIELPDRASTLKPTNGAQLLFPGRPPTRPLSPQAFSATLTRHGVTAHLGRNAALLDLAADLPAAVLADLLGISASTAVKWSILTGRDWASYLEARADNIETPNRQSCP